MNYTELIKGKRYIGQCEDAFDETDSDTFPFIFLGYEEGTIEVLLLDDIDETSDRFKEYLKKLLDIDLIGHRSDELDLMIYELDHDYYEELVVWGLDKEEKITTCMGFQIFGFEEYPYWMVQLDAMYKERMKDTETALLDVDSALELGFKVGYKLAMQQLESK